MTTAVTVCVPVFNAAAFLGETLDSIAAQSFADIKVLISLDRSDDDSESVCRRYLHDRRFELIVQRERLGWVGNVNALIERVDTPYFCITPHDDLLAAEYLAEVYALAASDPAIACAYSDVQGFGTSRPYFAQADIRGTLIERVIDFLLNHFAVVPFRGLIRRRNSNDRPYIPTGLRYDFAADTVWMLHIALRGELRRVPSMLYAKRYHDASVHAPWRNWPREKLIVLWAEQAAACARIALEHVDDPRDREVVLAAALMRVAGVGNSRVYAAPKEPLEIAAATAIFCDALGDASSLRDVQTVLAYPNARRLRDAIARDVSPDGADSPSTLAPRIRRRLGNILASMMRS
jgi:glycosyltransferase involved in cell wall biosynthesis